MLWDESRFFFSDSSEDARLIWMAATSSAGFVVCRSECVRDAATAAASSCGFVVCSSGSAVSPSLASISSKLSWRQLRIIPSLLVNAIAP